MTQRDRESEFLRATIHDLREADARRAPAFDAVLSRRRTPKSDFVRIMVRAALAAGVVLVAALAYRGAWARAHRLTVPSEVVALSQWRPPTDALLETPGREMLRDAPKLGASLIATNVGGELR